MDPLQLQMDEFRNDIWDNWENNWENSEVKEESKEDETDKEENTERSINYKEVFVTEAKEDHDDLIFYAQHFDEGPKLEELMSQLRQEFAAAPPVTGYYIPEKGDICAAKFSEDEQWYRGKIMKVQNLTQYLVLFIDYGNKELRTIHHLASLPEKYLALPACAYEYALAFINLPKDMNSIKEAQSMFRYELDAGKFKINIEYKTSTATYATLITTEDRDIGKSLLELGFLSVEETKDRKFKKIISEYLSAQETGKRNRNPVSKMARPLRQTFVYQKYEEKPPASDPSISLKRDAKVKRQQKEHKINIMEKLEEEAKEDAKDQNKKDAQIDKRVFEYQQYLLKKKQEEAFAQLFPNRVYNLNYPVLGSNKAIEAHESHSRDKPDNFSKTFRKSQQVNQLKNKKPFVSTCIVMDNISNTLQDTEIQCSIGGFGEVTDFKSHISDTTKMIELTLYSNIDIQDIIEWMTNTFLEDSVGKIYAKG